MTAELPMKMRVRAQNVSSQIRFALLAQASIAASECYQLQADRSGLIVFATTESELEDMAHMLRDIHEKHFVLEFGSPMVCMKQYKGRSYQPIIHLRIRIQAKALQLVLLDLMDRQARLLEIHHCNDHVVIRARAVLSLFIGYLSNVRILTHGLFELWLQVVDYSLVQELDTGSLPPGERSAGAINNA